MTTPGAISWVGLLTLMVDGPDLPVRGVISSREGAAQAVEEEPVLTRVWRSGRRVRLEHPNGRPSLIVGEERCWQFRGDDPVPVESPSTAVAYQGNGTQLLHRRDAGEFTGDDFTRPTGPVGETTYLGRPAYTVELAPPAHKPFPIQLVVDAETGLVLQQRNDGFAAVDEWTELVVGEDVEDRLFCWEGPSRSEADERAEHEREWQADLAGRAEWFRANVAPAPLRLELELGVFLHVHEPDGSFQASIGESGLGMLARRPSSQEEWQLAWSEVRHRWTADGWDWALSMHHDQLTDAGLAALKQALGRA